MQRQELESKTVYSVLKVSTNAPTELTEISTTSTSRGAIYIYYDCRITWDLVLFRFI